MASLELENGEKEILHTKNVMHGIFEQEYKEEFYLTNMHLICVRKGCFGKIKAMDKIALSQITIDEDGDAKIMIDTNKKNNGPKVQIFVNNIPQFFYFLDKNTANEWGNTISQMLTGRAAKNANMEMITNAIKGIKTVIEQEIVKQAAGKCSSCGAPMVGPRGTIVTCKFCGNQQTLE